MYPKLISKSMRNGFKNSDQHKKVAESNIKDDTFFVVLIFVCRVIVCNVFPAVSLV